MNNYDDMGFLFPYVRFFNASPQGGSLDFYIGNTLVAAGIKFGSFTDYIKLSPAPANIKVTSAGIKTDVVCSTTLTQKTGEVCTVCVTGKPTEREIFTVEEPNNKTNMEYGHIRICNLVVGDSAYDIYASGNTILQDIGYKEISRYIEIIPGVYEISVIKKQKTVSNCPDFKFKPGKFNTVYIIGTKNEIPHITQVITTDAASYSGFYL